MRLPGKKIDTWVYDKNRNKIDVPVRLVNKHFEVHLPELDISEEDEKLAELQRKVFALLDEKLALTWEPYLYIEVSGSTELFQIGERPEDDDFDWNAATPTQRREYNASDTSVDMSLSVSASSYLLTTNPAGQKLHRRNERGYSGTYEGWPETGADEDHEDNVRMQALVPDTPTAREALNLLSRDLERLKERLNELFAPERVNDTLQAAAAGIRFLPGASEERVVAAPK